MLIGALCAREVRMKLVRAVKAPISVRNGDGYEGGWGRWGLGKMGVGVWFWQ
jgi:hypothetical protein